MLWVHLVVVEFVASAQIVAHIVVDIDGCCLLVLFVATSFLFGVIKKGHLLVIILGNIWLLL